MVYSHIQRVKRWPIFSQVIDITFLDYLRLFLSLIAAHFESSNAYNFLSCELKHQVWVGILRNILVPKEFRLAENIRGKH